MFFLHKSNFLAQDFFSSSWLQNVVFNKDGNVTDTVKHLMTQNIIVKTQKAVY